jgi:hypothetical protein
VQKAGLPAPVVRLMDASAGGQSPDCSDLTLGLSSLPVSL